MSDVLTSEQIPNNVNLGGDKRFQRALVEWQPKYLSWWREMGPEGFQSHDVFLRTPCGRYRSYVFAWHQRCSHT